MPITKTNEEKIDETKSDIRTNPAFWAFHPIGRGIGTALLCKVNNTALSTGFIYGALSGGLNIAMRPLVKAQLEKTTLAPEHKAIGAVSSVALPWVASAGIMHQLHKMTGRSLFRISPASAIASAIVVGCLGYANEDLLKKKPNSPV